MVKANAVRSCQLWNQENNHLFRQVSHGETDLFIGGTDAREYAETINGGGREGQCVGGVLHLLGHWAKRRVTPITAELSLTTIAHDMLWLSAALAAELPTSHSSFYTMPAPLA